MGIMSETNITNITDYLFIYFQISSPITYGNTGERERLNPRLLL